MTMEAKKAVPPLPELLGSANVRVSHNDLEKHTQAYANTVAMIRRRFKERRIACRGDLLSDLLDAEIDGRPFGRPSLRGSASNCSAPASTRWSTRSV
jgi:hypothetical protein